MEKVIIESKKTKHVQVITAAAWENGKQNYQRAGYDKVSPADIGMVEVKEEKKPKKKKQEEPKVEDTNKDIFEES